MTHHPIPPTMQQIGTLLRSGSDYGFLVRDENGVVHFHVAFTDHELDPLPVTVDPLAPLERHADVSDDTVKAVAVKIIRWGIDEARERDAMWDEATGILLAAESGGEIADESIESLTQRIEAAIDAIVPTDAAPSAPTELRLDDDTPTREDLYTDEQGNTVASLLAALPALDDEREV